MAIRLLQTSRVTEFARNQDLLSEMLNLFTCRLIPAQPSQVHKLTFTSLETFACETGSSTIANCPQRNQVDQQLNCSFSRRRKSFRSPPEGSFLNPRPRIKNGYCPYIKDLTAQQPSKKSHFTSRAWGEDIPQQLEPPNSPGKASFPNSEYGNYFLFGSINSDYHCV